MLSTAWAYITSGTFEGRLVAERNVDFVETHKHSSNNVNHTSICKSNFWKPFKSLSKLDQKYPQTNNYFSPKLKIIYGHVNLEETVLLYILSFRI
jgi:hypothetical protein